MKNANPVEARAARLMLQHLVASLGRAFPVLLFLACTLFWVHQTHVLRFMEPITMRLVYQVEREACLPWLSGRATDASGNGNGWCSALGGHFPGLPGLKFAEQQAPQVSGMAVTGRGGGSAEPGPRIQIFDLDTSAFDVLFDRRLPLPRGCMADVLVHLAAHLPEPRPNAALPVVMLDMDVTSEFSTAASATPHGKAARPGTNPPPCHDTARDRQIDEALGALVRKSVVVALMIARSTPEGQARRDVHRQALCERFGQGTPQKGRGMLHLAAADVFWRAQEPVYEFPLLLSDERHALAKTVPLPPAFPSLGVLAGLAWRLQQGKDLNARELATVRDSLTAACKPVADPNHSTAPRATRLQEFIGDRLAASANLLGFEKAYEFRKLNLLQAGLSISTKTFSADAAARQAPHAQRDALLKALAKPPDLAPPDILALSVQDGSSADQFSTPDNVSAGTPGAWVHAAAAFSTASADLREPGHLKLWLLDILIGCAYALMVGLLVAPPQVHSSTPEPASVGRAWMKRMAARWRGALLLLLPLCGALALSLWGAAHWQGPAHAGWALVAAAVLTLAVSSLVPDRPHGAARWPFLRNAWHIAVPVLVAICMVSIAFYLSALQLPLGVWFDPLFMTLGMAMHAYLELPHLAHAKPDADTAPLWRLFIASAWSATDVAAAPGQARHGLDLGLAGAWRLAWLALLLVTLYQLVWGHH